MPSPSSSKWKLHRWTLVFAIGALGMSMSNCRAGDPTASGDAFQGFGLKYHLGYGYGGRGAGVGPAGGYPFYGGPGYLHCEPPLRRFGKIVPFPYFGGPGYTRVGNSVYFNSTGPLVIRPPVVQLMDHQHQAQAGAYGDFTGSLPYPDNVFAPYSPASATTTPSSDKPASGPR